MKGLFAHTLISGALLSSVALGTASYDRILLKFDPDCQLDGGSTLTDYITNGMRSKRLTRSGGSTVDPELVSNLLSSQLDIVAETAKRYVNYGDRYAAQGRLFRSVQTVATPISHRLLKETPSNQREDEILSALHIMAAAALGGDAEKATNLLDFEQQGDISSISALIAGNTTDPLPTLSKLAKRGRRNQVLTVPTSLEFLQGMKVIENPLLGEKLVELAEFLPCLELVEADEALEEEPEPVEEEDLEVVPYTERTVRASTSGYVKVDVLNYETLMLRMEAEEKAGNLKPSTLKGTVNQTLYLKYPNDALISDSWHLYSYGVTGGGKNFGMSLDSGWAHLIYKHKLNRNPELIHDKEVYLDFDEIMDIPMDVAVAVMDSGCAKHVDLLPAFWRNKDMPGCNENTFVGTQGKGDNVWYNDCVGFDFGLMQPDPTKEEFEVDDLYRHGTGVMGSVAARGNNGQASVGACPNCKVMCLKHKDANGKIYSSNYLTGYDYIVAKKIKISNHSYSGQKKPSKDAVYKAIEIMEKAGHLFVAAGSNNKCSIEVEDPTVSDDCKGLGYTARPAGYDLDNIFAIGSSKEAGKMSSFSSWGEKSMDVFAPGSRIITTAGKAKDRSASGTSFSAPLTAGVAAILWSEYPNLDYKQVKEILMKSGAPDAKYLKDKAVEPRVVNLHRALVYAEKYVGNNPETSTTSSTTTTTKSTSTTKDDGCIEVGKGWFNAPPAARSG